MENLSALLVTVEVEPVKFGETPALYEAIPNQACDSQEGVETGRQASHVDEGTVQTTNSIEAVKTVVVRKSRAPLGHVGSNPASSSLKGRQSCLLSQMN